MLKYLFPHTRIINNVLNSFFNLLRSDFLFVRSTINT